MKYLSHLLLITLLFNISCTESKQDLSVKENERFEAFKEEFLLDLWNNYPGWASWAGLHEYDSILHDNTEAYRNQLQTANDDLRAKLDKFNLEALNDGNKIDFLLIENHHQQTDWNLNEFKSFEWNPTQYNVAGRAWTIINGNFDELDARLRILSALLAKVPSYYKTAIDNIKTPTMEHLDLGLLQNRGGLGVLNEALNDSISASSLSDEEKDALSSRIDQSKEAINTFISELETMKSELTDSAKSSRIGKELYFKKYALEINSNYTAEQIYQKALEEKSNLHAQMITITDTLWDDYLEGIVKPADKLEMVKMLIDKIAEKHVSREEFFNEINRQIPILSKFVDDNDLLTQDPDKPLVVRETPLYMRGGGAGASVSSPGPYEKGRDTYYNVTPLDNYSDEQAESYLREYNHYILQILNIHEAIPGHYTQLVYGNKSPSVIKSILGNGAMIEGWANYAEIMMLEEGYNNSPEMWLMRNKWHLRGVTNTILDFSYHVLGLSREEAMKLMVTDAFQEQTEAENKWRRVTLSSVQLSSYFTGFSQIYELRNEIKGIKGDEFVLKDFHEQFLSYGNAPVKHIRELMLKP